MKEYKPSNKTYEFDSFNKMLDVVTSENQEALITDMYGWISFYLVAIKQMREDFPEETKGKSNTEILGGAFIWIDDGKHDVKSIQIRSPKTGEIHEVKFE